MLLDFNSFNENFFSKLFPKERVIYEIDVKASPKYPKAAHDACPYYGMMIDYILPRLNEQIKGIKMNNNDYQKIIDEVAFLINRIWINYTYLSDKQLEREYHHFLTNDSLGI